MKEGVGSSMNKNGIKAAILTMSFVQMGTNGIAAILADLSREFSGASVSSIQFLMTFPNIFVVGLAMLSTWICRYVSRMRLVIWGLSLVSLSGVLSVAVHRRFLLLYACAALLGIGIGFVASSAYILIANLFEGMERSALMGLQSSAANLGSMMMTFLGGILASVSWYLDYLVYLIAIPGLLFSLRYLPETDERGGVQKGCFQVPARVWITGILAALYMLLFYMGPTNLSLLVAERQIGDSMLAGAAATFLLLGGTIVGLLFGRLSEHFGTFMVLLGFGVQAIGFYLLYRGDSASGIMAAAFVAGMGVSITLPQCMLQLAENDDPQINAFATAYGLACANLGTFLAPALTGLARGIMRNDSAGSRMLFCCVLSLLLGIIAGAINHKICGKQGRSEM